MRLVGGLLFLVALLLAFVSVIYAHRVARLVPFAKDYGVPSYVKTTVDLFSPPVHPYRHCSPQLPGLDT
ncbi:MAG: hypothetical protein JWQ89_4143 [Devosia sp.]|nr:hypothetical protein [Devosia sp.]